MKKKKNKLKLMWKKYKQNNLPVSLRNLFYKGISVCSGGLTDYFYINIMYKNTSHNLLKKVYDFFRSKPIPDPHF